LKKRIYISVTNDLVSDQRVHRLSKLLLTGNTEVYLIGRDMGTVPAGLPHELKLIRFKLLFNKGFLFYAFINIRLFLLLLFKKKIDLLVANDLDTLLPNYLVSRIRKCPLVFDSHEYFTEVPELMGRNFVKKIWGKIENYIVPELKYAITVNDSLAEIFEQKYGTHFEVVRNVPDIEMNTGSYNLPEKFNSKKIILYQGSVNQGRGLEMMIELMKEMNGVVLVIAGEGDIMLDLRKKAEDPDIFEKIHFTGRLSPENLRALTKQADLGISLEQNMGLNYFYALPNKIFDYIHAQVPVLCSDFPEMKKIIELTQTGMTVNTQSKKQIKERILKMLYRDDLLQQWKKNAMKAAEKYCWQNEQKILKQLYIKAGILFENE
jgi:glycosyltransferase involved in cell wall biosynthesis